MGHCATQGNPFAVPKWDTSQNETAQETQRVALPKEENFESFFSDPWAEAEEALGVALAAGEKRGPARGAE